MARKASFTAIPSIPHSGVTSWEFGTLTAMKENIELLMGARGTDHSVRAVVSGQITVSNPPAQQMSRVSAETVGYTISGASVPSLSDYTKLVVDVQTLANDVSALRGTLSTLINQLKG